MRKLILKVFICFSCLLGCCLLVLMLMQLHANKEELTRTKGFNNGMISNNEKVRVLQTLQVLEAGYAKRDLSTVDNCVASTFSDNNVLILGTNPTEILSGKEGAKNLLLGDWKYWGNVKFHLDNTCFDQLDSTVVYIATTAEVQIDLWRLKLPLRITGILVNENSHWLISKLQFQYDKNTNLLIFSWVATICFTASFMLTLLVWLWTKLKRKTPLGIISKY